MTHRLSATSKTHSSIKDSHSPSLPFLYDMSQPASPRAHQPARQTNRQTNNAPTLAEGRNEKRKKAIINSSLAYRGPKKQDMCKVYGPLCIAKCFVERERRAKVEDESGLGSRSPKRRGQ